MDRGPSNPESVVSETFHVSVMERCEKRPRSIEGEANVHVPQDAEQDELVEERP